MIIGIIVVIAFITIDTGIIGNYKNNFSNNISKVFKTSKTDKNQLPDPTQKPDEQYNTEIKSNEIVSFEVRMKLNLYRTKTVLYVQK